MRATANSHAPAQARTNGRARGIHIVASSAAPIVKSLTATTHATHRPFIAGITRPTTLRSTSPRDVRWLDDGDDGVDHEQARQTGDQHEFERLQLKREPSNRLGSMLRTRRRAHLVARRVAPGALGFEFESAIEEPSH